LAQGIVEAAATMGGSEEVIPFSPYNVPKIQISECPHVGHLKVRSKMSAGSTSGRRGLCGAVIFNCIGIEHL
jgi:hypothetical protein